MHFEHLTGYAPFGWQVRLYERLLAGDIPSECDIPTGLGKTSVLAVWLLALAAQAARPDATLTLPRRLVYIVDRRAVVDQATAEAEQLLKKLRTPSEELAPVAAALRALAAVPDPAMPFALSTLRGQFADNRRWSHDPARPAVIVGTVDMVGSRLLFQGYGGLGAYNRSQHAALLGQDALLVLDEAQLAPAFVRTLRAVEQTVQATSGALARPFAFMSLTATQPRTSSDPAEPVASSPLRPPLGLDPDDLEREPPVRARGRAPHHQRCVGPRRGASGKADDVLAQRMAHEAIRLAGTNGAVVVFVDKVTLLEKIDDALAKLLGSDRGKQVLRFNGQLRGYERDRAFGDGPKNPMRDIFQQFQLPRAERTVHGHPLFLLATSAGEVGVNFDADHAVCDLVSLERMAQRLGRVNRAGDPRPAQIAVFLLSAPDKLDPVPKATHRLLSELPPPPDAAGHLASPEEFGKILRRPDAGEAFTPASGPPPLDLARLDDWSLTSLSQDDFARPQVSYWLRGVTPEDEQTATQLVWRDELRHARDSADAADLAETCPPLPREIVQVPTYRAANWLAARLKKKPGGFAALRTAAGEWKGRDLLRDFEDKDRFEDDLANASLVLPTTVGGLTGTGFLEDAEESPAGDVLNDPHKIYPSDDKACRRALFVGSPATGWEAFDLSAEPGSVAFAKEDFYPEIVREAAEHFGQENGWRYRLEPRRGEPEKSADADDGEDAAPVYRVEYFKPARVYERGGDIPLGEHLAEAEHYARAIVSRLDLPPAIREAVVLAASWHDLGKDRDKWQRAIGNPDPGRPLAKSSRPFYDRRIGEGYRHEFGSLMDVLHPERDELRDHPERALVLHLIAAHHGRGRPGFREEAYDVPKRLLVECAQEAQEAELRFDALQRRLGWWALAYLEALVKCADGIASDRAASPPENKP